jgi:bifunctional non-homologous end joining protein LigD
VAEVKFAEWTSDKRLRAPVFIRMREDKSPSEILRIEPVVAADKPTGKIKQINRVKEPTPQSASGESDAVKALLQNAENDFTVEVEGNKINLTNLGKVLWPSAAGQPGCTKRDFLNYLAEVSPYILPHLKDRPLTLSRYPDGINGEHFYQKHWGHPVPEFVHKVDISEEKGSKSEYLICDNLASLIWLGQVANIEFHSWFSRVSAAPDMPKGKSTDYLLDYPDFIIFDLDPYIYSGKEAPGAEPELNRAGFDAVCDIALRLKKILDELELNAFIKTSGKTGLHIHVPIIRHFDYKSVRSTAEIIGKFLVRKYPGEITTEWAQEKRKGKIFVDYGQNVRGKTLASIYSPRPVPGAPVSTPLRWEELGKIYPTDLTLITVPPRLKKTGDLWAGILSAKKDLDKLPEIK